MTKKKVNDVAAITFCPFFGSEIIKTNPMTFDQFLAWAVDVSAALAVIEEPASSEAFRRTFFQIFDTNPKLEKTMLRWLENNSPKTSGVKIPEILAKIVYAVGIEAFNKKPLVSYYFPKM